MSPQIIIATAALVYMAAGLVLTASVLRDDGPIEAEDIGTWLLFSIFWPFLALNKLLGWLFPGRVIIRERQSSPKKGERRR